MSEKRIVALCLVTQPELELLGPSFYRAFPIDEVPCFGALLEAIDEADRKIWRERDAQCVEAKGAQLVVVLPTV